jgi:hypothetical protein
MITFSLAKFKQIGLFLIANLVLVTACRTSIGNFQGGIKSENVVKPTAALVDLNITKDAILTGTPTVPPPPLPSVEKSENLSSFPGNGVVNGEVCYPSRFIPEMTVYFENVDNGSVTSEKITQNQKTFSAPLLPGTYIAFAYPDAMGEAPVGGAYTEMVACGMTSDCTDHDMRPFVIKSGEANNKVAICDWYAQEKVPSRPKN